MKESITIRKLTRNDHIPYELLLLADPSLQAIEDYLHRGSCYLAYYGEDVVGVYVLLYTRPVTMEIVNIAVKEEFQGKGLGRKMIADALERARMCGCKTVEIGTGNSSLMQLGLYQKCGFRIHGVDRNFFSRHYSDEIIENGIRCVDMIRLSIDL